VAAVDITRASNKDQARGHHDDESDKHRKRGSPDGGNRQDTRGSSRRANPHRNNDDPFVNPLAS